MFLSVLWVGYPTVWALGTSGIRLYGETTEVALFVVLPILSKVGFSLFDRPELRKLGTKRPSYAIAQELGRRQAAVGR